MNPVKLNNIDHAALRVLPSAGRDYVDKLNQAVIFPSEFEEIQREFTIIFRRQEGGLQAFSLLGLDKDENLFLSEGRWSTRYIPASLRRGPFSIGVGKGAGSAPGEPMIYIDMDDPRVGHPDGHPLFLEHGGNAPYLEHIADVLQMLFQDMERAPALYQMLDDAELLVPVTLSVEVSEALRYSIPDVLVVDAERLAALTGEQLETLYRSGAVQFAIMAAASLGNIQSLISRKQAVLGPDN